MDRSMLQGVQTAAGRESRPIGRAALIDAAFLAAVAATVLIAYWPSLAHLPRADQWCFLLDTLDEQGFLETFGKTWSYNRTRQVCAGDSALFRPVLFALLSLQKGLFGPASWLWQLAGILWHLLACGLLLFVLKRFGRPPDHAPRRDPLPYALTLFFALNYAIQEQVIWAHISGYMLFCALLLAGMLVVPEPFGEPCRGGTRWRWVACLICLVTALFTYEITQPFLLAAGAGLGLLLWRARRGRMAWVPVAACVALVAIYQACNQLDLRWHANQYEPDLDQQSIMRLAPRWQTVVNFGKYVIYTLVAPWMPQCSGTGFSGRLYVSFPRLTINLPNVLGAAAACGAALLALRGARQLPRRGGWSHVAAAVVALSLISAHAAAVVLGRMNPRPEQPILTGNSYYSYVPLLFSLVALVAMAAGARQTVGHAQPQGRWSPGWAIALVLLATSGWSAARVWRANVDVAAHLAPERACYEAIAGLLRQAGARRVAIDPAVAARTPMIHGTPRAEILFRPLLEQARPDLVICDRHGQFVLEPADHARRRLCRPVGDLFPRLVAVGRTHNLYRWNGQVLEVPCDGPPLAHRERDDACRRNPVSQLALSPVRAAREEPPSGVTQR